MDILLDSFLLHKEAEGVRPNTLSNYRYALEAFLGWLDAREVTRDHIAAFLASQIATRSNATALNRYKVLTQYFRWAVREGEIAESPMAGMQAPRVVQQPPPVFTRSDLLALMRTWRTAWRFRMNSLLARSTSGIRSWVIFRM